MPIDKVAHIVQVRADKLHHGHNLWGFFARHCCD
jgi:hypothetical protein